jgi:hypothetical protein
MIDLGCPNGTVLAGDLCDLGVGIYVSLDNQLPSLFVDSAEITGLVLFGKRERRSTHWKQTKQGPRRHGAYADVSGRVPIWPFCGRPLDQIDVLSLSILP